MSKTTMLALAGADVKTVEAKAKSVALEGERMMRVIATAPTVDRDLEIIDSDSILVPVKPTGLKLLKEMTPSDEPDLPFLVDHEWALEKQAGSLKSIFINADGKTEALVELSSVDNGERVYTLAKEGHLGNSFSIGYSYMNATFEDNTWYGVELLELSGVFKGSNRDARLLEVKSIKEEKSNMTEVKTVETATKEELEAKLAEIKEAEQSVEVVEEVKEEVQTEVVEETKVEAPVEEAKVEEPEVAEEVAEPEETKSIKKEKEVTKMTKVQDIAVKQVEEKAVAPSQPEVTETKSMDKVEFAAKQFSAWVNGDKKTLTELNEQAIKSYADQSGSKATYLNATTTADGGAIVPNAQLLADVYSLLENYSTVSNDLRVITLTEGDSLDVATLVADVVMTEVETEGGTKPVTKPVFGDGNIALREFAGIAILTKKLVRQAAVNVFDILVASFARAIANQRAIMALTDAESGIVNKAGVVVVGSSVNVEDVTWSEVRRMPYRLPTAAVPGAKYYISRELLEVLDGAVDGEGRDLDIVTLDGTGLSGRFKNGFAFAVEEVLGDDSTHAVFGNMSQYGILLRQGTVEAETFDTGTVVDGSAVTHNLLQQNKLAHRQAFYENVGYPLPGAFAILSNDFSS